MIDRRIITISTFTVYYNESSNSVESLKNLRLFDVRPFDIKSKKKAKWIDGSVFVRYTSTKPESRITGNNGLEI